MKFKVVHRSQLKPNQKAEVFGDENWAKAALLQTNDSNFDPDQNKYLDYHWCVVVDEDTKLDTDKTRMELFPADAMEQISEILTSGAKKYTDWGWADGMKWSLHLGAALRHIYSWSRGQDKDPESGKSHLAHAACRLIFLLTYERRSLGTDDRKKFT